MWLLFGLLSASTDAGKNVLAKRSTGTFNSIVITWAWVAYSLILLLPLMFWGGIPALDQTFWLAFSARVVLDIISLVLYVEALRRSDLSLTLPMLALTPLFLLGSGLLLNNEWPSTLSLAGVLLIVAGTYFLNFKRGMLHALEPLQAIYKNTGALMMLAVAIIWGVTGSLHKLAILHSNPYFYTGLGALVIAVILTPLAWWSSHEDFKKAASKEYLPQLLPIGILDGITVLSQFIGQSITLTVLVISLKRTSIIFSSLMGWALFKEDIRTRIAPICVMVLGVILIALGK
jgi:drug/metabolite transporter (DMT)-like permease